MSETMKYKINAVGEWIVALFVVLLFLVLYFIGALITLVGHGVVALGDGFKWMANRVADHRGPGGDE